jgi:hypothetical protein
LKKLFAAVCVERMPVVSTEMNELEKRHFEFVTQADLKKSFLSTHELRDRKDKLVYYILSLIE